MSTPTQPGFKWVRLRKDTYDMLTTIQVYLQFVKRRKLAYDDVVREVLESYLRMYKNELQVLVG